MQSIIKISGPLDICLQDGQQIAVIGDNAAGKTDLVNILLGRRRLPGNPISYDFSPSHSPMVSDNIRYIAFQDAYGEAGNNYYHQLRWNSVEIDEETPTAGELLDNVFALACASGNDVPAKERLRDSLYDMFGLRALLDKYIISLSSGELRKFQIARALFSMPRVLILDNPFIGLDASTRDLLSALLGELGSKNRIMMILVMSRVDVLPSFITHIIPVEGLKPGKMIPVPEFKPHMVFPEIASDIKEEILSLPPKEYSSKSFYKADKGDVILKFNGISIRYDTRTILDNLSWTVREGECWAITGQNGAGKSTLLSLVCADNPQAYACDFEVFGHKRGTGESIWDIKRHIGYVSPEMHRSYQKNITAIEVVASGLFDTVGLYMHPDKEQLSTSLRWMKIFGIDALSDRSFLKLSSGEQRMCLLARAFVKDPELLILDEPMHGLDLRKIGLIKQIIDTFIMRPHKTLLMVSHYKSELPSCITNNLTLIRH